MAPSIYSTLGGLPLPLQPGEIRLVKILPHENDTDAVSCTLEIVFPDAKSEYTALSYVWGSSEDPITIKINGIDSEVTQSLGLALHGIRKSWGEIVLWIDAISINQSDLNEKASQIPLMGNIYRNAERVISWMGQNPGTIEEFQECMEALQKGDRDRTDGKAIPYDNGTEMEEVASALLVLGGSEYWKRTWIVQEFLLAKTAFLQSGTAWVDWNVVSRWIGENAGAHLHYTTHRRSGNVSDGGTQNLIISTKIPVFLKEMIRAKRDWEVGVEKKHDLLSLMNRHVGWKATNPRDKIWGFLGIANESGSFIKADYSMPLIELYSSFTQEVIKTQRSLRIIQSAGIGLGHVSDYSGLPSWVPEWSAWDEEDHVLDCEGTLYHASKSLPADFQILDNGSTLQVQGILFDSVSKARGSYRKTLEGDLFVWFIEQLGRRPVSTDYITGTPLLQAFFRVILYDRFEKTHHRLGNGSMALLKILLDYWAYVGTKFTIKEGLMTVSDEETTYLSTLSMMLSKDAICTLLYGHAEDHITMGLFGRPGTPGSLS